MRVILVYGYDLPQAITVKSATNAKPFWAVVIEVLKC